MALPDESALGMVETRGLVAAIEAADAMVKASEVRIVSVERTVAALITIHVFGETAAVQAAVEAGRAAAARVGELIAAHVIPRPDDDVRELVLQDPGALGRDRSSEKASRRKPASGGTKVRRSPTTTPELASLESMTVQELRKLARQVAGFPIQGREIARANKKKLIELLRLRRG